MSFELGDVAGLCIRDRKTNKIVSNLKHGELTIGRAADNELVIDNATVSAHHARIFTYLTASYIEDRQSTNGTFVDDKRITKHMLKPGCVIRLGSHELVLEKQGEARIRSHDNISKVS